MTRIVLFDYGAGNLHSLGKALAVPGVRVRLEPDAAALTRDADAVVLPGVGAWAAAAARLDIGRDALRHAAQEGLPLLGICLGMQLFFETSAEGPGYGLGLLSGAVTRLRATRVPQIGWNEIDWLPATDIPTGPAMGYYANSFACRPQDSSCVRAWSTHDTDRFPAAVAIGRALGVQFHPEKSSAAGVQFLRQWVRSIREAAPCS